MRQTGKRDTEKDYIRHRMRYEDIHYRYRTGKCRKSREAFEENYEECGIIVLDAEKYGFVKLQYFSLPGGFENVESYTDGAR